MRHNQKYILAEILAVGDELLTGALIDNNSAYIAEQCEMIGLKVTRHSCVGDNLAELTSAIQEISNRANVVIVTGGLGPTLDDLSREAAANAADVDLVFHNEALAAIKAFFAKLNRVMPESNERQTKIRKTIHNDEWWFVIEDVVLALIESNDSKQYIQRMRQGDPELSEGWVQIVHTLDILTTGGKQRMNCANTEGVFRIIQSIPSPKAELFKRWLAKVGYERVQEIEDPEIATKRTRALYKAKGYPDAWIDKRMRGIAVRATFTF